MSSKPDEASAVNLKRTSAIPPDAAAYCAEARELALRIDRLLEEAARTTTEMGALRLAQAFTGTLLDELERLQHQRAA